MRCRTYRGCHSNELLCLVSTSFDPHLDRLVRGGSSQAFRWRFEETALGRINVNAAFSTPEICSGIDQASVSHWTRTEATLEALDIWSPAFHRKRASPQSVIADRGELKLPHLHAVEIALWPTRRTEIPKREAQSDTSTDSEPPSVTLRRRPSRLLCIISPSDPSSGISITQCLHQSYHCFGLHFGPVAAASSSCPLNSISYAATVTSLNAGAEQAGSTGIPDNMTGRHLTL